MRGDDGKRRDAKGDRGQRRGESRGGTKRGEGEHRGANPKRRGKRRWVHRKGKRRGGITLAGSVLDGLYPADSESERHGAEVKVWWERKVSDRIFKNARPERLHRGVLLVHVTTSAWAQELSFMSPQLLDSVHARLPHVRVDRLRFRVAPLRPWQRVRAARPKPQIPPLPAERLPEGVAAAVASVRGGDVREAVLRAVCAAFAHQVENDTNNGTPS